MPQTFSSTDLASSMESHTDPVRYAFLKFVSALGVIFTIDAWTTLGKFCAAAYSIAILSEWLWKKVIKPFFIRQGWRSETQRGGL